MGLKAATPRPGAQRLLDDDDGYHVHELAISAAIGRPASRENVDERAPLHFKQHEGMLVRSLHAAEGTERRSVRIVALTVAVSAGNYDGSLSQMIRS